MKKLIPLLAVALCIGLLTGCSTTNNPETWAADLETAAFLGTSLHLRDNEGDRSQFEDVRKQLALLSAQTNSTTTDIVGVVQSLPFKGDALFYREAALLVLRRVNLPTVPIPGDTAGVQALIGGLDHGIARGLATVEASKKVKAKVAAARSRGTNAVPVVPKTP